MNDALLDVLETRLVCSFVQSAQQFVRGGSEVSIAWAEMTAIATINAVLPPESSDRVYSRIATRMQTLALE